MSIIISFILLLICNIILIHAQGSKAVMEINYETKQIPDSTNINSSILMQFTLLCNKDESVYFNKEAKAFYDILYKNKSEKNNWSVNNMMGMPKFPKVRGSIFKSKDGILANLPVAKDMYQFEEPVLKWEILQNIKEIKGFKCQLAKTKTERGDEFFAWFTEDIKIPDGPFRFKGLAGLILEVYNKNKTIEIYATDIKKSDAVIEPIDYGKIIQLKSKDQYIKTRTNYLENPSGFTNNDIQVTDMNGNNLNKKIDEKLKKVNVFID